MDGSKSSDDVLCYKDAVQFVKFSKRKLSSTNVHKTRRRFARDEVYRKKVSNLVFSVVLLHLVVCCIKYYLNKSPFIFEDR